jgi:hypothetical protein
MIARDNQGKIVGQIEYIWDANGNSVSTNTSFYNEKPVVQQVTIRDRQGHVESRTILGGKIFP